MREKIWNYKNKALSKEEIEEFSALSGVGPAMAVILLNRGIKTPKAVNSYMKKSLEDIHNPFMLDGMEEAADRILSAIEKKEKIVIYGDYDVDGITTTATVYKFLKSQGADVSYYIPDRFSEGYGINILAINKMARDGAKLMITVDCGITAVGEVEFAKTQGLDIIITDHHTCREELPKAVAVINPKRADNSYPFSGLAGVGVAFKLVLALAIRLGMNTREVFMEYVDMVALGTIADVVPLIDENRVIADKGINSTINTKNKGMRALMELAGAGGKSVDANSVAFFASPRLNAAGRLESASLSVELMICDDDKRAKEIAEHLDSLNTQRKEIEQKIFEEAYKKAEEMGEDKLVYVISGENWNHGVIGIVASRIAEMFYRPCILISVENGKGKGSGRSVPEMNLFDALSDSEELLTAFGGHSQAAGLSIAEDNIEEFTKKINEYAKKNIDVAGLVPKLEIDCNLSGASVTMQAAKMIEALAPFGEGNEIPVFSMRDLKVIASQSMGVDKKHLRLRLTDGNNIFNAVGFGMGEYAEKLTAGTVISIAFNMNINTYQGSENLQLILKDIKF
ncbi:MAG: single-stranded-DNA-specific exonuclease RecJ [Clostridia bacterium]|nr:single-stranded-DNA-specific exonuclease RecJ [Clostridia bacterium]